MAFSLFKQHYQLPTLAEGIDEIGHVNFVPDIDKLEHISLFYQYLH